MIKNVPSILTERQAGNLKTCPLTLSNENPQACLGSRCAAWLWQRWPSQFGASPNEPVGRCGFVGEGVPFPVAGRGVVTFEGEEQDEDDLF